jgi:hypothetical protein
MEPDVVAHFAAQAKAESKHNLKDFDCTAKQEQSQAANIWMI